jgi:hypothetical protein
MLNKYKRAEDAISIDGCIATLNGIHERIVGDGSSRNETTLVYMREIVDSLRKLERNFQ